MNKKRNKRLVSICIVILVIILGGVITMNLFNQEEVNKEHREQEAVAEYCVNHITLVDKRPIREIEFVEVQKDKKTGFLWFSTIINGKYRISFSQNESSKEIDANGYYDYELSFNDKSNNSTLNNIKITYVKETKNDKR